MGPKFAAADSGEREFLRCAQVGNELDNGEEPDSGEREFRETTPPSPGAGSKQGEEAKLSLVVTSGVESTILKCAATAEAGSAEEAGGATGGTITAG